MLSILAGTKETLRRRLIAQAGRAKRMLVIVPEQYTLQTERELMDGLNLPGFFDLEVLSPSRLTERVFAQAGADRQAGLYPARRQPDRRFQPRGRYAGTIERIRFVAARRRFPG